jgi:DNA-binding NarL/FixJ family response regulator
LQKSIIQVLVVDDYERWRRFVVSALQKEPEFQVAGEARDGLEAVQKAEELQPELILLDIGLPKLNGIQAAQRIRSLSSRSKILFISENRTPEIASEALRAGGSGYVIKSSAGTELFPAIRAVLKGERFVSRTLAALLEPSAHPVDHPASEDLTPSFASRNRGTNHRHEMAVYSDDHSFVDGIARGAQAALKAGDVVIVIANASHREGILEKLQADGVDISAAIKQGTYVAFDNTDTVSKIMNSCMPDPARCVKLVGDLIARVSKNARGEHARVAFFGECSPALLADGNVEAAVRLEHHWDELMKSYDTYTLCGYLSSAFPQGENDQLFERICAEHSAVRQPN